MLNDKDKRLIARALKVAEQAIKYGEPVGFTAPQAVKEYLILKCAGLEHEIFGCLFLSSQHNLISAEEMFRGTLSQAAIYPREIVKRALALNAGAVVLYHNHPSGLAEHSLADAAMTKQIEKACALVDVRVLDHVIVAGGKTMSFAEKGLL